MQLLSVPEAVISVLSFVPHYEHVQPFCLGGYSDKDGGYKHTCFVLERDRLQIPAPTPESRILMGSGSN
jgi:hypothetical protein